MISSLPKSLQNDFDTIVIDILSRYSLDNKSVRYFVENVAQQIRGINRLPRVLKEAKSAQRKTQDPTGTEDAVSNNKEKPNFLTRLQGYQSAWNRGSLVGVFLEYLKNRREDQQAKLVQQKENTTLGFTKEKSKQEPIARTVKSEKEIVERFSNKITETRTNILERVVNNLQKIQEIFSSPGLLGATKSILSEYEKSKTAKPVPSVTSTTSYTGSSYNAPTNNYSTVNIANTDTDNDGSIELTRGEAQAQKPLLPPTKEEPPIVILGGINQTGKDDLESVLKAFFKQRITEDTSTSLKTLDQNSGYEGPGLLDTYLQYKGIRSLFGGSQDKKKTTPNKSKSRSKPSTVQPRDSKGRFTKKPTTSTPKSTAKPGRFIPKLGPGGLLRGIGTLGLGMLADWGGQMAGGEIAKDIYGEEKTAAAYEEYGADVFGLFKASYDATKAIGEVKEAREQLEKQEKQTIPLDIKAMMFGYKDLADFSKAVSSGEEKRRMYWDDKNQAVVVISPDKTQEIHKFTYGKGFQGKPEIIGPNGKQISQTSSNKQTTTSKSMPVQNPEVKPLPPDAKPPDIEKPSINLISPPSSILPETTKISEPTTSLTPEIATPVSPIPPSITETHITNNNQDKKALSDIVSNTSKTNQSLATLGDAVFKLAKVFDSKTMSGNSSIIVNGNGQAQEYTSTSQIAANNVDSTRRVRQEFLAALG